ncbi:hypothetical protein F5H01DRAFT_347040 [Linnemannia elongata]|nr:hypothetical protein F5H01DRAFT_347040 [Linnemannia elongata]
MTMRQPRRMRSSSHLLNINLLLLVSTETVCHVGLISSTNNRNTSSPYGQPTNQHHHTTPFGKHLSQVSVGLPSKVTTNHLSLHFKAT